MTRVSLLFVGSGRRVELLRLFRRAAQDLGLEVRLIATDIDPLAPSLQEADVRQIVPRLDDPGFLPTLLDLCRAEQVDLVFPLIDPAIPVLAGGRTALEAAGCRVVVVGVEAAEITRDKWKTVEWLRARGLPTPPTWLPEALPASPAFPLFVRPRSGSAGRNAFRVDDARQLDFFLGYVEDPIVQAFVAGAEITSDVYSSLDGSRLLAVVSRRRIEVRWGEVHKGVTVRDPDLIESCRTIGRELGAVGPITIQCLLGVDGRPLFTEINARFAGGMPLGVAAGVPAPEWVLREAAGMPLDPPPVGTYRTGVYLTRYDDSFFLDRESDEPMAGGGV